MLQPAVGAGDFWRHKESERQKHMSSERFCGGRSIGCFLLASCLTIHLFQWLFTTEKGNT